ncbi:hypothetical protein DASB73_039070 [Starmerella bacillaris]|uniref:FYVE-type domain-containing protein n=1 Tax=Starmerella bacillaris TaxID=1247836 RepID=A0AAV5RN45_STABA|nr:hypothetical protein DASB73_039070 [Starmerella bacillaris]
MTQKRKYTPDCEEPVPYPSPTRTEFKKPALSLQSVVKQHTLDAFLGIQEKPMSRNFWQQQISGFEVKTETLECKSCLFTSSDDYEMQACQNCNRIMCSRCSLRRVGTVCLDC